MIIFLIFATNMWVNDIQWRLKIHSRVSTSTIPEKLIQMKLENLRYFSFEFDKLFVNMSILSDYCSLLSSRAHLSCILDIEVLLRSLDNRRRQFWSSIQRNMARKIGRHKKYYKGCRKAGILSGSKATFAGRPWEHCKTIWGQHRTKVFPCDGVCWRWFSVQCIAQITTWLFHSSCYVMGLSMCKGKH